MAEINFTPEKVKALRKRYNEAVRANEDTFTFEGHELVRDYAKYLLEYLDSTMKGTE